MPGEAAANRDALERTFATIGTGNADAIIEHYTPDYVLELPYRSTDELFRVEGREATREYLRAIFRTRRFELRITEIHPTLDPALVIAEYTSQGVTLPERQPIRNVYIGLWSFREGKAFRTREYYNPALSARNHG